MKNKDAFDLSVLIAGYLKQELSPEEERRLMQILEADPSKMQLLEYYKNTAANQSRINRMENLDLERAWNTVLQKRKKGDRTIISKKMRWFQFAAAIVLIGSMAVWFTLPKQDDRIVKDNSYGYKNDVLPGTSQATLTLGDERVIVLDGQELSYVENGSSIGKGETDNATLTFNTLKVPKAGFYKLVLPDGSRVWVNALSELRFPVQFNADERRVFLQGEAYFEVEKDANRPFKVAIGNKEVEVLGTSFNVSAYENTFATTLLEGSVKVRYGQQDGLLMPGQQAIIKSNNIKIQKADIEKAIAWKDGYFYFNGDNIRDILNQLALWYDVDLRYDGKMPASRLGGSISRNVNLGEVLEMLKDVSDLEFQIDGRDLIIRNKQ